jgi:hypothetical protein
MTLTWVKDRLDLADYPDTFIEITKERVNFEIVPRSAYRPICYKLRMAYIIKMIIAEKPVKISTIFPEIKDVYLKVYGGIGDPYRVNVYPEFGLAMPLKDLKQMITMEIAKNPMIIPGLISDVDIPKDFYKLFHITKIEYCKNVHAFDINVFRAMASQYSAYVDTIEQTRAKQQAEIDNWEQSSESKKTIEVFDGISKGYYRDVYSHSEYTPASSSSYWGTETAASSHGVYKSEWQPGGKNLYRTEDNPRYRNKPDKSREISTFQTNLEIAQSTLKAYVTGVFPTASFRK